MRLLSKLATLAALVAAAACNGTATAPTDADLVGTWTIVPRGDVLAGDGMGAMTVAIGPDGGYTLEAATFAAPGLGLAAYGRSFGSITTEGGTLRFHPSGGMAVAGGPHGGIDARLLGDAPLSYRVVGNRLFLQLPPLQTPVLVLTRKD